MLILTRRIGETLRIGENIEVHILSVKGCQIRVGIDAPREINVVRTELLEDLPEEEENNCAPKLKVTYKRNGYLKEQTPH